MLLCFLLVFGFTPKYRRRQDEVKVNDESTKNLDVDIDEIKTVSDRTIPNYNLV